MKQHLGGGTFDWLGATFSKESRVSWGHMTSSIGGTFERLGGTFERGEPRIMGGSL